MNITDIIHIVKGLFTRTDQQWQELAELNYSWKSVLFYFTIPLLFLSSFASVLGTPAELRFNLPHNELFIVLFTSSLFAIILSAYMIAAMAPRFNGEPSFEKTFVLISFSYTPVMLASLIGIIHDALQIVGIAGLVFMILFFIKGLRSLLQVPPHKQTGFALISLLLVFAVRVILTSVMTAIVLALNGTLQEVINQ